MCFHLVAAAKKDGKLDECLEHIGRKPGKAVPEPNLMSMYRDKIQKSAGRKPTKKVPKTKVKPTITKGVERIPTCTGGPFTEYYHNNFPWEIVSIREIKDPKKICPSCEINFPLNVPYAEVGKSLTFVPFNLVLRHQEHYEYYDRKLEQWVKSRRDTRNIYYCLKKTCYEATSIFRLFNVGCT